MINKTSVKILLKKEGVKTLLNEKTLPLFKIKNVKKTSVMTSLKKYEVKPLLNE